jgi:uncharacterized SAM-binding protein YcdF (DUF218 family)
MPARNSTFLRELGPGGFFSLTLALGAGAGGLGLPVFARARQVLARAKGDPLRRADAILVLGRELDGDRPTPVFRARLEHGAALLAAGWAERIVVSGGMTGTATRSEAAAGRELLLGLGVEPGRISIEERSRFTLENLWHARETLRAHGGTTLILVSDPLHLARAAAFARGLGVDAICSPAVAAPPAPGGAGWWLRAAREAFLLHWYHVGVAWSRAIGSERMLSRVT